MKEIASRYQKCEITNNKELAAVLILKERFDIDYHINDVKFTWGGEL